MYIYQIQIASIIKVLQKLVFQLVKNIISFFVVNHFFKQTIAEKYGLSSANLPLRKTNSEPSVEQQQQAVSFKKKMTKKKKHKSLIFLKIFFF